MIARSHVDLHNIRVGVERIRNLSDRIVGLGPLGVGLDGVLSLIPVPVVGTVYSGGAAALLLLHALRARASVGVFFNMALILAIDTLLDVPAGTPLGPFSGLADTLFTGHKWAANMLLKHMDETLYVEGGPDDARNAEVMAGVRSRKERRRVVFLG
jgi:hypothetical protein